MNNPARPRLILASASPRRRELLASIGLTFEIVSPDVDESFEEGVDPVELTKALAEKKSQAIAAELKQGFVLAADTIVAKQSAGIWHILGKPQDAEDAERMLSELQDAQHVVITGFSLHNAETGQTHTQAVRTEVRMRSMNETEIKDYVASGEAFDKAGAYGIQGKAAVFISEVSGSYTNVVGLPLLEVASLLQEHGLWSSANLTSKGSS